MVPQPPTGRAKKYVNDAHRNDHFRRNKAALKAIQSNPTPTPPTTSKPSLIGSNGVDYSDPYKVMPAHLACYMPVQSHESLTDKLAFEHRIHSTKPAKQHDADCKF
jgi:hypothetical protein